MTTHHVSRVSIRRCDAYDLVPLREAIAEAVVPLGGISAFVRPGMRVVLKPNYVQGRPAEQGANTHPHFILAVAQLVREAGGEPVVADSPGWGTAEGVARTSGFAELARQHDIPIRTLDDPVAPDNPAVTVTQLRVSRLIRDADLVINLPKFKAHQQLLLTLAVKNVFGCVPGRRKAALHMLSRDNAQWFGRMLVENYLSVKPGLTIMDGIVAMEGRGPSNGTPRQLGVIIAGTDCVAIDRVAVEIVGVPWQQLCTLAAAAEMGVGCTDLEKIEVLGPPLESLRINDFRLPLLLPISFSPWRILRGLVRNFLITWRQRRELERLGSAQP